MSFSDDGLPGFAKTLPDLIPVFPLAGVLLLPGGELPLNIFKKRYIAMVDQAFKTDRLIGIIQPRPKKQTPKEQTPKTSSPPLYEVGCAGRIIAFSEEDPGRYMITLRGMCRFKVKGEAAPQDGYRQLQTDWSSYLPDLEPAKDPGIDRDQLKNLLESYFQQNGLNCDWDVIRNTPAPHLITCLSMICPFAPEEKQALLEAPCTEERAARFIAMIKMALHDNNYEGHNRH